VMDDACAAVRAARVPTTRVSIADVLMFVFILLLECFQ
jgi:hypothetical protein